jgi:hypothetical protein
LLRAKRTPPVSKFISRQYLEFIRLSTPFSINASVYDSLPYDTRKDFAPVSLIALYPNILVISPGLPAKNVAELISYASPRELSLAARLWSMLSCATDRKWSAGMRGSRSASAATSSPVVTTHPSSHGRYLGLP